MADIRYSSSDKHDIQIDGVRYGNKTITDGEVIRHIRDELALKHAPNLFIVNNDHMRGDPQPGVVKVLTIDYRDYPTGPHLRLSIPEGWAIPSRYRISRVMYGGLEWFDNPEDIEVLNKALLSRAGVEYDIRYNAIKECDAQAAIEARALRITNETMGGDPKPGVVKHLTVAIAGKGGDYEWLKIREGLLFPNFSTFEKFKYEHPNNENSMGNRAQAIGDAIAGGAQIVGNAIANEASNLQQRSVFEWLQPFNWVRPLINVAQDVGRH
ncbi:hypothetical protein P153DRAFT_363815 [Dothidotthia symphoricarpi CBS 119687]|uniref:Uncharacterized protein n=1 Tax=Dothidotthia symphoricarpi CBS 119687 TaxID=1392245 RepID=A0A6A6ALR5_9PLEO|nr:uncharacterized protein P153DRAFT_363815 [Dothidotthia symphoricarpi CBS 119687]KAF2132496.1 hypothetical protein P153DRAFT_363815 [Dothidotthia symphoricarpi CBS 119687]